MAFDTDYSLCAELYKLTGWHDGAQGRHWYKHRDLPKPLAYEYGHHLVEKPDLLTLLYPVYEPGWLLRKLQGIELYDVINLWEARLNNYSQVAETPEDALCKLAILLVREGAINA